ncbi:oxidoreductase/short-chain dehydrogenase/reductase SDR [Acidocella aminolytica 101 = DSM 11237]|uniref:Oxidoreductase/short-chain dehydrogenase/reductase SDR n=2 Tax=Acidocella TaxID=50709 RepID=A0A0D6PK13_9PROT|nr:SDR family oxidoreductase [Acidocella aminolytica]GAN82110.1 oxidoreductase/short-chain dehydrogenase/reductase SDR [Acidocella aminolytica 101 = DSM 11237]GBQ41437.1 dehydrogenase [Acidocella aminolytica 101 = DSM 11237]
MEKISMDWLCHAGRVCVVTGAAGGIGKEIADQFAHAGAAVAYLDLNAEAVIKNAKAAVTRGGIAIGLSCNVAEPESVAAAASKINELLGPTDILINNAGILRPGDLSHIALDDWELMLRVNVTGYMLCAQQFGRGMLNRGKGNLVHIASIAASEPQAFSGAYSPGKAAIAMLSRQLAFEWGAKGVRSNCVSPGMIRTPLSEAFYQTPGIAEKRAAIIPARRIGEPRDIAEAVLFLASSRAGYITGQEIVVDGGFSQSLMSFAPRPGY